jgi:hypothetical protein
MRKAHGLLATLLLIGTLAGCRVSPQAKQTVVRAASSAFFSTVLALESAAPTSQSTLKPAPPLPEEAADFVDPDEPEPVATPELDAMAPLPVPPARSMAGDDMRLPRSAPFRLASLAGEAGDSAPLVALEFDDPASGRATRSWSLSGRSLLVRSTMDVEKIRTAVDARLTASSCPLDRALAPRLSTALRAARIQLEMMQAAERAEGQGAKKTERRLIVFASSCLVQDAVKALGTVGVVAR